MRLTLRHKVRGTARAKAMPGMSQSAECRPDAVPLRREKAYRRRPFVEGSDATYCKEVAANRVATMRRKVLLMHTGIDEAAIRDPVDRATNAPPLSGITRVSAGEKWPMFVKALAAGLACMAPLPKPMLVNRRRCHATPLARLSPD